MRTGTRGAWLLAGKLIVTTALLAFIGSRVDGARLWAAVRGVSVPWALAAFVLLVPNLLFQYACWRFVLAIAGVRPGAKIIFESLLVGYTFALVTPGGLGEMGRGLYFEHRNRLHMVGLSFVQKFYSLLVTAVLGMAGAIVFFFDWRALAAAGGITAVVALGCSPRLVGKTVYRLVPYLPLFRDEVRVFLRNLSGFYSRRALVLLLLSACGHLVAYLQYYLLFRAFGASPPLLHTMAAVAVIFFAKALLPVSVGDLGLREGLTMYFFGRAAFGIAPEVALNVSLVVFAVNLLVPSLAGAPFVHRIRWRTPPGEETGA